MPISGLSDIRRIPRIDKIRLGEKRENEKGKEYPVQLSYLKVPETIQKVYGEKPVEIDVMFASEDMEINFPQYRKLYGKTGLKCKGDGIRACTLVKGEQIYKECTPNGPGCEKCKPIGTLNVLLPKIPGFGVFSISTSSWNSIVNLNSCIDVIRLMTSGKLSFVPLKLRYKPHVGHIVDGDKEIQKTVYVLSLDIDDTIQDFYQKYNLAAAPQWHGLDDANEKIAGLLNKSKQPETSIMLDGEEFGPEEEFPTHQQLIDIQVLAKQKGISLKKDGPALAEVEKGIQWKLSDWKRCWDKLEAMPDLINEVQINRVYELAAKLSWSKEAVNAQAQTTYKKGVEKLTEPEYKDFCLFIETMIEENEGKGAGGNL